MCTCLFFICLLSQKHCSFQDYYIFVQFGEYFGSSQMIVISVKATVNVDTSFYQKHNFIGYSRAVMVLGTKHVPHACYVVPVYSNEFVILQLEPPTSFCCSSFVLLLTSSLQHMISVPVSCILLVLQTTASIFQSQRSSVQSSASQMCSSLLHQVIY